MCSSGDESVRWGEPETKKHVSVQLMPTGNEEPEEQRDKVQEYLDSYYERLEIHVYWGDCRTFAEDLKKRWEAFGHD